MRIAKPMLAASTPVGVAWALVEAWRFHWWLAVLMAILVGIVGAFTWMTFRRIRQEQGAAAQASSMDSSASHRS
jgi:hypothetical protein